jgi:3-(3-hydroxy-phenyl)propionate hydroxylase
MHERPRFEFRKAPEQNGAAGAICHPVVIVGAGPVGLSLAIDLATRGIRVVVVDDDDTVSEGSRAIAWAKRTLEIWARMRAADRVMAKGVGWEVGKVFYRNDQLYQFTMKANASQEMPAFVNLQQYYVEEFLVQKCIELGVEIRWLTRLSNVSCAPGGPVAMTLDTPAGSYRTECDWMIAADGARSQVRKSLGLEFKGQVFNERFLIMDIRMLREMPAERWFWFDPPFNPNHSALLHMQADNVWRVGNQLGIRLDADFDAEYEKSPARVQARIRAMLGEGLEFEVEWVSIFTFQCRRLEKFVHDRIVFIGDAAHQVSPFGGRGANSGVQDADNLAWKLELIINGSAPARLLESFQVERGQAADENILISTQATDFVTPKNKAAHIFRHAVLSLARTEEFARPLVNSGRLSVPTLYDASPLSTPDSEPFSSGMRPGAPCIDAPLADEMHRSSWLLHQFDGRFCVLIYGLPDVVRATLGRLVGLGDRVSFVTLSPAGLAGPLVDRDGVFAREYDARDGTVYLIRPDQHVAARWREPDLAAVTRAFNRACAYADKESL